MPCETSPDKAEHHDLCPIGSLDLVSPAKVIQTFLLSMYSPRFVWIPFHSHATKHGDGQPKEKSYPPSASVSMLVKFNCANVSPNYLYPLREPHDNIATERKRHISDCHRFLCAVLLNQDNVLVPIHLKSALVVATLQRGILNVVLLYGILNHSFGFLACCYKFFFCFGELRAPFTPLSFGKPRVPLSKVESGK